MKGRGFVTTALLAAALAVIPVAKASAGACCLFNGSCTTTATEGACGALGGVFLPSDNCATSPCAVGACCSPTTCNEIDAYNCISGGRDFVGAGTTCAQDGCGFGTGACCIEPSCVELSETACAAQSGIFLGLGSNCLGGPCDPGSCCLPGVCFDGIRNDCDDIGAIFAPGSLCAAGACETPFGCPLDALYGQQRDDPDDFQAYTSESSIGYQLYDDFSSVPGEISVVRWYGLDLEFVPPQSWVECVRGDPTFEISFHLDAGGVPGALVCSYTLAASRTPTGILYIGAELNEYEVTLPAPCVLVNGWISIVGLGDPDCWFLWMSAGLGGGHYCDGCVSALNPSDLAFCFIGPPGGVFGACCDDAAESCTDDVEIDDCTAPGLRFVPDTLCANLVPPCGIVLGACCFADASCSIEEQVDCEALGGKWLGANSLCEQCPCVTPCPPGGVGEGEETCSTGYVDLFNGGCFALTPAFSLITAPATVCGQSGIYLSGNSNVGDFDWYELNLEDEAEVVWEVETEFEPQVYLINGTSGCPGTIIDSGAGLPCETTVVSALIGPGTYWLVVGPLTFTDTSACGTRYTATLTTIDPCPADLDGSGDVGFSDLTQLLINWGPCDPDPAPCAADLDGNGDVGFGDLTLLLINWGPCRSA